MEDENNGIQYVEGSEQNKVRDLQLSALFYRSVSTSKCAALLVGL
jgi:hypothetical protein